MVQTNSDELNAARNNYFYKFLRWIKSEKEGWNETTYENPNVSSEKYYIELYIIHHILQYMKTATLQKSTSRPEELRTDLKMKIVESSDNTKNLYLYCGTSEPGDWGRCTVCHRWTNALSATHSNCADVNLSTIKKMTDYKCSICSNENSS